MKIDLEAAVDNYLNSVGLLDERAPEFARCIYVYDSGPYARKVYNIVKKKKLKIPIELLTEKEIKERSQENVPTRIKGPEKRVYHLKIDKSNISYYLK